MYGFYAPILFLQAFCIYHAYRKNAEQRWFWLIVLLPLVGSVIYLVYNFNNRETLDTLKENVKVAVNSKYRLEKLENALKFSDNITNKLNLADAYTEEGRHQEAIALYAECLQGFMADDPAIRMKLLKAFYLNGNYRAVVEYGNELESERSFKDSDARVAYAWSLFHEGNVPQAEHVFDQMNIAFTNYHHRMEFCKFLLKTEKPHAAKETLTSMMKEFDQMQSGERRLMRDVLSEVKAVYAVNFSRA